MKILGSRSNSLPAQTLLLFMLAAMVLSPSIASAQVIHEEFSTDAISGSRFIQVVAGTESNFKHDPDSLTLRATLDVDQSPAYYLSNPFAPVTDTVDSSFSVEFRVEAVDDQFTPTGFIGLMTTNHIEDFGHGLTMLLATDAGRLNVRANIDANDFRSAGSTIPIELQRNYLAVGRYKAATRQLTIEVFDGNGFTNLVGFSTASLPAGRSLRVDRIGLQNGGAENFDRDAGSIALTVDNLFTPGSNPNSISISNASVIEGNSGTKDAVFTLTLSPASSQTVTVEYTTADGTAKAGTDYVATFGKVTFSPGVSTATISVPVIVDTLDEEDETFFVRLSNAVDSTIARLKAVGTIQDDDNPPNVSVNDASAIEGDLGGTNQVPFTIALSAPSGRTISVNYSTSDGTATNPQDYSTKSGSVVFPPGVTTTNIGINVVGDLTCEGNQQFSMILSVSSNANLGKSQGVGTIVDDDCGRLIQISDASVVEGGAGTTTQAVFVVTLNRPHSLPVSVDFFTVSGTATVGTDLLARSGTLVFPPGATQTNIAVTVLGDNIPEEDETFSVSLSNPVNAELALPPRATGTITNDDPFPRLSISDVTVTEGNTGTTAALYSVRLSLPAIETVTVNYTTTDGTAKAGSDYVNISGTLTFTPGVTNQTITVLVNGDVLDETDENFFVQLSSPAKAIIERGQGVGTIIDGADLPPSISITDVNIPEPDSGTGDAIFTVNLSAPSGQEVRVSFNATDDSANAGSDYSSLFGTLIFPPGMTRQTIKVVVQGDKIFEGDETFFVNLSTPANATIAKSRGVCTIVDNDGRPTISINNVSVTERLGGTNAVFTISLFNPTRDTVTVDFSTADDTARSGADYISSSGTLTFSPGTLTQTVTVRVLDDLLNEDAETFTVKLSNATNTDTNSPLSILQGIGTIRDNDIPRLNIGDISIEEGDAGQTNAVFTITLSTPSTRAVSVAYATANGTATAGEDYLAASGTISFPPGNTSATVSIPVLGDTKIEPNETFFLNLSTPINAELARTVATCTILDDDNRDISIDDATVVEGKAGTTTNAVFTVTLSKASPNLIIVSYATANGTATAGSDYQVANGTVTFAPGETRKNIVIVVLGDDEPEQDEDFFVRLSNPLGGSLKKPEGRGVIIDDDLKFRILPAGTIIAAENCHPSNNAVDPYETVTVNFALVNRGNIPTPSVTATLLVINGVTPLGTSTQTYGVLTPNGPAVPRPFTFSIAGVCGQPVAIVLQLRDGINDLGTVTFEFVLGVNASGSLVCCSQADLAISVIDQPDPVFVGDPLVYQVIVTNRGPAEALKVALTNRLAAGMKFISIVPSQGQWTNQNDLVIAQLGSLAAGTAVTATVTVVPQTSGRPVSIFRVSASSDDPDLNNNTAVVDTTVRERTGISIENATVVEGNTGTTNVLFNVRLSPPSGRVVTVAYQTVDGTAIAEPDYIAKSGTLTFAPGVTLTNIVVSVIGDTLGETNETFSVILSNPVEAPLAPGRDRSVGTILDDDKPCLTISDLIVIEPGIGNTTEAIVPVTLSQPSDRAVTVDYLTEDATATAGVDYAAKTGSLTFLPGITNLTLSISISGDSVRENDESFHIRLRNPVNALLCREQAAVTIHEEPIPTISITDFRLIEGDAGTSSAVFRVSLSTATGRTVEADFATADGTAQAGSDYIMQSGRLTFTAGTTQREVSVLVYGDTSAEPDETFFVKLTNVANATVLRSQAVGTIVNNDYPAMIVTNAATLTAENCLPGNGAIDPLETVTVNFAIKNIGFGPTTNLIATLKNIDGVIPLSGTQAYGALFPNSSSVSRPFTFAVDRECGATFNATLELRDGTQTLPPVQFEFRVGLNSNGQFVCCQSADVAVTLSDQPDPVIVGQPLSYTVTVTNRGPSQATDIMLTNRLADGLKFISATNTIGLGVTANMGNLVIYRLDTLPPASATQLQILARPGVLGFLTSFSIVSADESDPDKSNNTVAEATQVIPPTGISVGDSQVIEGGTTNIIVRLYPARGQTVSVTVSTRDGTATASTGDYAPLSGIRVTFPPGATTATVPVTTLDDTFDEPEEFFYVRLSDPTGAAIAVPESRVTIQDNNFPCLSIDDVDVNVGTNGQAQAALTVRLSSAGDRNIAVNYATADGAVGSPTNGPPATAGTDYVPKVGVLSFPPGVIKTNITIVISGNTMDETKEHFFVNLSGPVNATLCDAQGKVTITDESPGLISISDVFVTEGNTGMTQAVFVLTLDQVQRYAASVEFSTADNTAIAGSDYVATNGVVTFPPGVTSASIVVQVIGDRMWETNETSFLILSNARNAGLSRNQAIATIVNDDPKPTVTVFNVQILEGNAGMTNALFVLALTNPSSETITVAVSTANETAQAGVDYLPANGAVTFAPGQTNQTYAVLVQGDTLDEPDETFLFRLSLSNGVNATLLVDEARCTILDDDLPPSLIITDASVLEGDSGTTNAILTVSLTAPSARPISVDYATIAGTASAGSDYSSTDGTLTFFPGETNAMVAVAVLGDKIVEEDETFSVNLTNVVNVTLARAQATGTIQNDDFPLPKLSIRDASVAEGNSGITNAVFAVTLSIPSLQTVTVNYTTENGTATANTDYKLDSGMLTIPPGQTTAAISIQVFGDTVLEPDETFFIVLTNPLNATNDQSRATGTIRNDDTLLPKLSIRGVTLVEGNATTNAILTVTLSSTSAQPVTVDFSTTDGSATANSDYQPRSGFITIPSGQTAATISVLVFGDTVFESDEDFFVNLSNPLNATLAEGQARCLILNDDVREGPIPTGQILIIRNRPDCRNHANGSLLARG